MATTNMSVKLRIDFLSSSKSLMPSERPMPMIGPMMGEMSMAPMMTAVELTFRPSEAIIVAKINTHKLTPRNSTPLLMAATTSSRWALSSSRLKRSRMNSLKSVSHAETEARRRSFFSVVSVVSFVSIIILPFLPPLRSGLPDRVWVFRPL